jgi:hypothetical protein
MVNTNKKSRGNTRPKLDSEKKSGQTTNRKAQKKDTDGLRYKAPEPWVRYGRYTQLGTPGLQKRYITIGIDFGTAFTKASVGLLDKIYIVNWNGVIDNSKEVFTLPCEFSALGNNYCVLGHAPNAREVFTQLKHPFLEGLPSAEDVARATAFLALVLRYVRAWLFHQHGALVRDRSVIWSVNIGIPSKPFENKKLQQVYRSMASLAWQLSSENKPITLQQARRVEADRNNKSPGDLESIAIIPEFVAQIASYVQSPQRQPDLHMIMDVGAGTIDVATFNIHEIDGENIFPIFSSEVKSLGTHFLTKQRIALLNGKKSIQWDDFSPVLSASDFCKKFKVDLVSVENCDDNHSRQVSSTICSVLHHTRTKRYRISRKWGNGIRVFFCGGGSESAVFGKALDTASKAGKVALRVTPLPFPANAEAKGLNKNDFHRVAVAYGLGIYAENLGRIQPAAEVADDEPVQRRIWERPDRDELYPK